MSNEKNLKNTQTIFFLKCYKSQKPTLEFLHSQKKMYKDESNDLNDKSYIVVPYVPLNGTY